MRAASALIPVSLAAIAAARTFTVYNGCPFTIWLVIFLFNHTTVASHSYLKACCRYSQLSAVMSTHNGYNLDFHRPQCRKCYSGLPYWVSFPVPSVNIGPEPCPSSAGRQVLILPSPFPSPTTGRLDGFGCVSPAVELPRHIHGSICRLAGTVISMIPTPPLSVSMAAAMEV